MKLAIGLMTCGREDLTAKSLDSFNLYNGAVEGMRFHVDDCSATRENERLAQTAGFWTVWAGDKRAGQLAMLRRLLEAAIANDCTSFLLVENDWEWVRALPVKPAMPKEIDCIRLYGANKDREGLRPCSTTVMGTPHPIRWEHLRPGWERGLAHWGGPPSIVRIDRLLQAMDRATNYKAISLQSTHFRTLRPTENFVFHIGDTQTPDFTA